ncbi:MAG: hypothetical protein J6J30_06170 [Clostridia bacterium]|jgi:hypothetical protein|nr:hypothetical protein [Clostridia bacterium]
MKIYNFNAKESNLEDFKYAYGPSANGRKKFTQLEDCIANFTPGETGHDDIFAYDYISMITKKKYKSGVKFSTKCNFVKFGAPLLVFCNDFINEEDGTPIYQLHYEVVAYEKGINIWHIIPWPERTERPIKPTLIGKLEFDVAPDEIVDIKVEVKDKTITADIGGHVVSCEHPDIPDEFHIGITACEGHNRFFDFIIEE